jgi:hypothetical protein
VAGFQYPIWRPTGVSGSLFATATAVPPKEEEMNASHKRPTTSLTLYSEPVPATFLYMLQEAMCCASRNMSAINISACKFRAVLHAATRRACRNAHSMTDHC